MKEEGEKQPAIRWDRATSVVTIIFLALAAIFYVTGVFGIGNFIVFMWLLYLLNKFVLKKAVQQWQQQAWPRIQDSYVRLLDWNLKRAGWVLLGTFGLLIFSFVFFAIRKPKVVFFPSADPNFAYVYLNLPIGVDQVYTNEVLKKVEQRVYRALDMDPVTGKTNPIVSSVIANVAVGATDPNSSDGFGTYPNKGKITVAFVQFDKRKGVSTWEYLDRIRTAVKGIPGAEITVDKEASGPPTAKPIVIEITGDHLDSLITTSERLKKYLDTKQIAGVEELRSDFQANKPEIVFDIDRERMNREGIATGTVSADLRTAVFGTEVSRFRDANDDYPITLRLQEAQRNNIDMIKSLAITYRDMAMGGTIRQVPLSAFADIHYNDTYGGIRRKNEKRIITLSSNVLNGYNANEVVANIQRAINDFSKPGEISIRMGGEQEDQKETMGFLGNAMLISLGLIFIILVTQFNSLSKPLIILTEIVFSIIGVVLGVSIFKMDMSIVMSGIGIVALAGIVVRNGILLVEFTDLMITQGMPVYEALLEAGRTRMTPVLLTATATILGLIPLAVGFNIDFVTLFTELNPHIYFGGDNVAFWGPLSWTMIFGLGFATFLTLILVPVLYLLIDRGKQRFKKLTHKNSKALID